MDLLLEHWSMHFIDVSSEWYVC